MAFFKRGNRTATVSSISPGTGVVLFFAVLNSVADYILFQNGLLFCFFIESSGFFRSGQHKLTKHLFLKPVGVPKFKVRVIAG